MDLENIKTAYMDTTVKGGVGFDKILVVSYMGKDTTYVLKKLDHAVVRIGRAADNDIQINSPIVADYHATLQLRPEGCYIIDGQDRRQPGQYDSTNTGLVVNSGQHIRREHLLENGEHICILAPNESTVTLKYINVEEVTIQPVALNKPAISIGRTKENDLVLPGLTVSAKHARVERQGNDFYLVHLSQRNPTYLNGKSITRQVLKKGDKIGIGPFEVEFTGDNLKSTGTSRGPRVDAMHIVRQVQKGFGKKKTLLNDITIPIKSGEFVALVGGSGTGKSTLLKSLIGILDIENNSQVLIDGVNLFKNFNEYRSNIGYVPQEDILHTGLTVEQVLDYTFRLRDQGGRDRKAEIAKLLGTVQLTEHRKKMVTELSGGQRKRLSVAVELAAEPSLLVLDEPSSGLDPGLDLVLMSRLAVLARKEHKTIILVTHTTENIDKCHKVAFLGAGDGKQLPKGGYLAFYGRPAEAEMFFGVDSFSKIYAMLGEDADPVQKRILKEKFDASPYYKEHIKDAQQPAKVQSATAAPHIKVNGAGLLSNIGQTLTLAQRYFQNNFGFLVILLFIPVFLTLLLYTVADSGLFHKLPFGLKSLAELLLKESATKEFWTNLVKVEQVIFMMSMISVFLGLFGSFQEIAKERPIFDRERLVNLNISSYVFSKFGVLAILAFFQSLIMTYVIDYWVQISGKGLTSLGAKAEVVITLFLVSMASVALGLLVSALVNRDKDRTIVALMVLVIVQILFSGAIFRLEGGAQILSWLTLTRWSTEALGSAVGMSAYAKEAAFSEFFKNLSMHYGDVTFMLQRWGILVVYIIGFLALTIVTLSGQDIVLKRERQK